MPPVPVVVLKIVVHGVPSGEVWIWNAEPNAASQLSTTWLTDAVAPRSTWIHCGSVNALDQRVPGLPSVAWPAGKVAFSREDAVVGLPWDSRVGAACAVGSATTIRYAAAHSATATA